MIEEKKEETSKTEKVVAKKGMVVKSVYKPKKTVRGDDAYGDWEVVDAKRETY